MKNYLLILLLLSLFCLISGCGILDKCVVEDAVQDIVEEEGQEIDFEQIKELIKTLIKNYKILGTI